MTNQINNAGDFFGNLLTSIATAIPKVLAALLVIVIGYIIAKVLCKVVAKVLEKANLDQRLHSTHGGNFIQKAIPSPTSLISKVVFWLIFLFAISTAVGGLGIPLLTGILAGIYAYIPNVIAAVLIFLVAGAAAGAVAGLVGRTMGDTPTGKVVSTVAPVLIMSIAGFMILNQLMIAPAIVTITYAAIMFGTSLAAAIAFGFGGLEHASRLLEGATSKAQENKDQISSDLSSGKEKAKQDAEKAKSKLEVKKEQQQPRQNEVAEVRVREVPVRQVPHRRSLRNRM